MNRRQLLTFTILSPFYACPAVLAQTATGGIAVDQMWARVIPERPTEAAVYLTLTNRGTASDRLLGISSDAADEVAVERTIWHGLVPKLDRVTDLTIRPGRQAEFAPGKVQITLRKLHRPLSVGQSFTVSLTFAMAGRIDIQPKVTNQLLGNRSSK